MYLVVSRWKAVPGKEEEFKERGKSVRKVLRKQPGVKMLEHFETENGEVIAIHGYTNEKTYKKVVHDPKSAFNKALEQFDMDKIAKWMGSDRGVAAKS